MTGRDSSVVFYTCITAVGDREKFLVRKVQEKWKRRRKEGDWDFWEFWSREDDEEVSFFYKYFEQIFRPLFLPFFFSIVMYFFDISWLLFLLMLGYFLTFADFWDFCFQSYWIVFQLFIINCCLFLTFFFF